MQRTEEVQDIINEVNNGLWDFIGDLYEDELEYSLKGKWDPCNDWGQLGFCIDYYENETGRRLLIEVDETHHTYAKLEPGVRAIGFYKLPEGQTMREGMWNITWAIYLDLKDESAKE